MTKQITQDDGPQGRLQRRVKKCTLANTKLLKIAAGITPTVTIRKLGNINLKANSSTIDINSKYTSQNSSRPAVE